MAGPKLAEARRVEVIELLRAGHNPMEAARRSGVSKSYVYGCITVSVACTDHRTWSTASRYLDRDERYELARLVEAGQSQREIAARMGRSPSTICRELARNRDPRTGEYQPERAHTLAWQRQRAPRRPRSARPRSCAPPCRRCWTSASHRTRSRARSRCCTRTMSRCRSVAESIYLSVYVYPRGELKRELKANLRSGRVVRRPRGSRRSGAPRGGAITGMVSIHDRPEEVAGRLVPGHHEGDLIKGSTASNSAVGNNRRTHDRVRDVAAPGTGALRRPGGTGRHRAAEPLPAWFAKTLTWDRGVEMARHDNITAQAGDRDLLRRPLQPAPARLEREHQRAPARVPAQGQRPLGPQRRATCKPSPTNSTTGPANASGTTHPASAWLP